MKHLSAVSLYHNKIICSAIGCDQQYQMLFQDPENTLHAICLSSRYLSMFSTRLIIALDLEKFLWNPSCLKCKIFLSSKNFISLLCVSFSKILSKFRKINMGQETISFQSFLWIGITLVIFKESGSIAVLKAKLNICSRCWDTSFWVSFEFWNSIL